MKFKGMKKDNFLIFRIFLFLNVIVFLIVYNLFTNEVYITSMLYEQEANKTLGLSKNNSSINACILVLCQENDIKNLIYLVKQFEFYFNKHHHYPYIFFNNKPFTVKFKHEINKHTSSLIEFAQIKDEHWRVPQWIDRKRLIKSLWKIGFSIGYRHMCRFYSGFFYKHELTLKYDYFMRLDDDSKFYDYIDRDPFLRLTSNRTRYGFAISTNDREYTMPTLWSTIRMWANKTNVKLNRSNNGIRFVSNDYGQTLDLVSLCMFYNNFELASFDLFRSQDYEDYFEFLDRAGGFYYERWVQFISIFIYFFSCR